MVNKGSGKVHDWIIIGAGAAGLFAGAHLPPGRHLIIESGRRVGLKLLMSGGGMCNFTHDGPIYKFADRFGKHKSFVKPALKKYDNTYVRAFFKEHGVGSFVDVRGKVFPSSKQASSLVDALMSCIEDKGIPVLMNSKVTEISCEGDVFEVCVNGTCHHAKRVLVATGGKSYPTTGSDGNGYVLAKGMGHRIEHPHVALAPVLANEKSLMALAGTAFEEVGIEVHRDGRRVGVYRGEMLITHDGLSGPVILDNSRDMLPGDVVTINMTKDSFTGDVFEKMLLEASSSGKTLVKTYLRDHLSSKRIADHVQEVASIPEKRIMSELSKIERKNLVTMATAYPVPIKCLGGFEIAMATAGGVRVEEVDSKTMMSKVTPGLYFAGEVLDVDGDSGGYNIQWAFSSGALAVSNE